MKIENKLKEAFDTYYEAPIEVWRQFAELCEIANYKKNQPIKQANQIERYGYFLLEGACGVFVWNKNNYVCLDLFLENSFFADDTSLLSGKQSPVEIIALEKSAVLRISKSNIELLKKTPMGSKLFMVGDQNAYIKKQQQHLQFMTKTAEERYAILLETQPELIKRIHQKHIASFLGITTQSLSRIRKK